MSPKSIPERVSALEQGFTDMCKTIQTTCDSVDLIKTKLLSRPSWAVTVIITLLTTITCGLIVYTITFKNTSEDMLSVNEVQELIDKNINKYIEKE